MVSAELATSAGAPAFDPIIDALQGALDGVARGEIDASRIAGIRSHLLGSFAMALETPASAANFLASYLAVAEDLEVVRRYIEAISAVTDADLRSVAGRYLTATRRFVVTMSPPLAAASEGGAS